MSQSLGMTSRAIDSYSQLGEGYDSTANMQSMWGRISDRLIAEKSINPDWRLVADVGCGTGSSLRALAARLPAAAQVVGVEPADGMRAVAEAASAGSANVDVRAGAFERLPLEDSSVDLLFSLWSFHWTVDVSAAVEEMARVLKPNGDLDLVFVGRRNGGRFAEITGEVLARHLTWEERLAAAEVMQPFDREMLGSLFQRFGAALSIEESFPEAIAPVEEHLAWQMRMEGHFAALTGERRAAFDRDLRETLQEIATDDGVPYVGHVLRVRVDGSRRADEGSFAPRRSVWGEELERVPAGARREKATTLVRDVVAELLERPLDSSADRQGLRDLGLGSLNAVGLAQRLSTALNRAVPNTVVFSHPTISALAELVLGEDAHTTQEAPPKPAAVRLDAPKGQAQNDGAEPIAVVGLACRFPGGADSPAAFWDLLDAGRDAITPVPESRWRQEDLPTMAPDQSPPHFGGFLDGVEDFDARFFRMAPTEAKALDPQHRLMLELSWEALEDAAIAPDGLGGSLTGVWAGLATQDQMLRLRDLLLTDPQVHGVMGTLHSVAAGRVAYFLDLAGPAVAVDTACSSSLVAIHQACQALRAGEVELALAGGVNTLLSPDFTLGLASGRMMAPDGRCKTFDSSADGFVRCEGGGVLALKRLDAALADGDKIHGVLLGSAVNQDGASSGLTAPRQGAQEAVIRSALTMAGLSPNAVDVIEAHGTGTVLGDAVELRALHAVFGDAEARDRPLLASSVKTVIGHAEAAAGVAGLIRVILQMRHGRLSPHLHLKEPNTGFDWDASSIAVKAQGTEWAATDKPRIAGVSSFGISGTNAHVIVADAPPPASTGGGSPGADVPDGPAGRVLMLSAVTESALAKQAASWRDRLRSLAKAAVVPSVADICATAACGRSAFPHRLAVTGDTLDTLADRLDAWSAGRSGDGVFREAAAGRPRIVFAFPGQGCQYEQMGRAFYETQPAFARAFDEAAEALAPEMDVAPHALLFPDRPDPEERLNQGRYSQPAIFLIEYALARLWQAWGIEPDAVIGHSFGEFAAACIAGILTLEEAAMLVATRARLSGDLPSPGGMAAVALGADDIAEDLRAVGGKVVVAADNGPRAVTVAGPRPALKELVERIKGRGGQATMLDISHPFHTPLMAPIVPEFTETAGRIRFGSLRTIYASSATGRLETTAPTTPDYWARMIVEPVRFREALSALGALTGPTLVLECSPRPVLMPLAHTQQSPETTWLPTLVPGDEDGTVTAQTLATLFTAGLPLNGAALQGASRRQPVSMPTYPFERARHWIEPSSNGIGARSPANDGLVGAPRTLANGTVLIEGRAVVDAPSWVADHAVGGKVYLPGANLIETLRAAAGTDTLRSVAITAPAVVPPKGALELQAILEADGRVAVHGRGPDDTAWRQLATAQRGGDADIGAAMPSPPILMSLIAACSNRIDGSDVVENMAGRGIHLGPAFHTMVAAWHGPTVCVGQLRYAGGGPRLTLLLDGCFQTVLPLVSKGETWLPFALDTVVLPTDPLPDEIWCAAERRSTGSDDAPTFDLTVFDSSGVPIGRVDGLMVRRAADTQGDAQELGEIVWRSQARAFFPPPTAFLPDPETVAAAVVRPIPRPGTDELLAALQAAAASIAWAGLTSLDTRMEPGATIAVPDGHLAGTCLRVLTEAGLVETSDGICRISPTVSPPVSPADAIEALRRLEPEAEPIAVVLDRVADALTDVLAGRRDGLEVLFPGGDLEPLAAFYLALSQLCEVPAIVSAAVERLAGAAPPDRALRILEVGGGTGNMTRALQPLIQTLSCRYTFTDIGPGFVERARRLFGHIPGMAFDVLDLETSTLEADLQDFERFDLILADNVVHATRDIGATLSRLRRLLRPGGVVLLVEQTIRRGWIDLVFGFADQWHEQADKALRPDHVLLDEPTWLEAMRSAGFAGVSVVGAQDRGPTPVALVLGQAPATSAGDASGCAEEAGEHALVVGSGKANMEPVVQALSDVGIRASASNPDALSVHWHDLVRAGRVPQRVILSAGRVTEPTGAVRSLLAQLQAFTPFPAELVLVTNDAHCVGREDPGEGAAGTALWGMLRAIAVERQEVVVRRIDLDPAFSDREAARALAAEIGETKSLRASMLESEVALRTTGRFVARIGSLPPPIPPAAEGRQLAVTLGEDRMPAFRPIDRAAPGPGQVEIKVEAAGLSFPDVLQSSGLQYIDRVGIGFDVAGVISRVGTGVTNVVPGDRILGAADGAMAQFVCTDARLVVRRPDTVTAEEAASAISAWVTVRLSLDAAAGIKRGESVLIHSAAGAVGRSAVQLARSRGCTIFATAHPSKHSELRRMGITHPLDSRGGTFGRQILALTEGRGVDVVLNALTTDSAMEANLTALGQGGRFIELGKHEAWTAERMAVERPDIRFQRIDCYADALLRPEIVQPILAELATVLANQAIKPPLGRVFEAAQAAEAFSLMRAGLNHGKPVVRPPPLPDLPGMALPEGDVALIIGGLGGLGLATAQRLVARGVRKLVLAARRSTTAEENGIIDGLRSAGAAVRVVEDADAATPAGLEAALAAARELGPLGGLVHAAGILHDRRHERLTSDDMARVLAPKLEAAWHLHRLTRSDRLRFFVVFGSLAGVTGNVGQAAHAAASAGLDGLMQFRWGRGLPGTALDLGRVSDVGAATDESLARLLAARGIDSVTSETVLDAAERLIDEERPQALLAAARWPVFLEETGLIREARFGDMADKQASAPNAAPPKAEVPSPVASRTDPTGPTDTVASPAGGNGGAAEVVAEVVGSSLGMAAAELPRETPLLLLGLDSLIAFDLRDRLRKRVDVDVPLSTLIGGATVLDIAKLVDAGGEA